MATYRLTTEHDQANDEHGKQESPVRVHQRLGKPGQDEHCSTDDKDRDEPHQRAIQGLPAPNVWIIDHGSDIRTPQPASQEKSKDREAETDT